MKHLLGGAATLALFAGAASADGISRADLPLSVMFETGNYAQLSFSQVTPGVSGAYTAPLAFAGGASTTGNMAKNYGNVSAAVKMDLSENLSFGLFLNQPYGANADYQQGFYNGLRADWTSQQLAAVAKYKFTNNFSVYGGLRYVTSSADIAIPDQLIRPGVQNSVNTNLAGIDLMNGGTGDVASGRAIAQGNVAALSGIANPTAAQQAQLAQLQGLLAVDNAVQNGPAGTFNYTAMGERDSQVAYLLGVAYERPEIALRVALTYESGFTHSFETAETLAGLGFGAGGTGTTEVDMPQSVRLDFQSGVAANTLVFGSVEWTEWSVWEVAPPEYQGTFGQAVTGLDNDTWRYQIGVGYRFSETFAGFARITHEPGNGGIASRLSPTDGSTAFGIGGTWTNENVKLTAGVEYVKLGDATDGSGVQFSDNNAIGFGLSLGFSF
ncbi:outer membrane protein transport protein [Pseudaestuariivita atlantica]|uniref:outer membrane protein transport protein n=1 Tax=Pseudaestuariivita atlantica TaxID=1317121 RepID=UPI00067B562F|nr:outer membrane protein transport protein [Pseudaestuariivita atlantica]